MDTRELETTLNSTKANAGALRPAEQEALDLVAQIATHDRQIGQLESEARTLPQELAWLGGHPVLWLLLGREGVDRPGGDWSTLVGQQVVMVRRTSWRVLLLVGGLMLIVGVGLGAALASRW